MNSIDFWTENEQCVLTNPLLLSLSSMAQTLLGNGHDKRRKQQRKSGGDDIDANVDIHIDSHNDDTPIRFLPLYHVYSATSTCSGSSSVILKKIKASKLTEFDADGAHMEENDVKMSEERLTKVIRVYSRRRQKKVLNELVKSGGGDEIVVKVVPVDDGAWKLQNQEAIGAWFV